MSEDRFRRDDDWSISEGSSKSTISAVSTLYSRNLPLLMAMMALTVTVVTFGLYINDRQLSGETAQTELEQVLAALDAAREESDSLRAQLLEAQNRSSALVDERNAALDQVDVLSTELSNRPEATAYTPIVNGTVAILFGVRVAGTTSEQEAVVYSFPFTRSVVPNENVRINSDTIIPAYSAYPTVGQSRSISWKRQSLIGYLNPQTELLVLQVIEVGDAYWIEACIVSGDDCGN